MSTQQEYWDACLIRAWRNFNTLLELNKMFHSITGKWPAEVEPRLLRTPTRWLPLKIGARYYTAQFLPKINDRLLAQKPEKDVALLRKLQESKYDTEQIAVSTEERQREYEGRRTRVATMVNRHNAQAIAARNDGTDWNKVKGAVKIRRSR